jgi:hypothetical protein
VASHTSKGVLQQVNINTIKVRAQAWFERVRGHQNQYMFIEMNSVAVHPFLIEVSDVPLAQIK